MIYFLFNHNKFKHFLHYWLILQITYNFLVYIYMYIYNVYNVDTALQILVPPLPPLWKGMENRKWMEEDGKENFFFWNKHSKNGKEIDGWGRKKKRDSFAYTSFSKKGIRIVRISSASINYIIMSCTRRNKLSEQQILTHFGNQTFHTSGKWLIILSNIFSSRLCGRETVIPRWNGGKVWETRICLILSPLSTLSSWI